MVKNFFFYKNEATYKNIYYTGRKSYVYRAVCRDTVLRTIEPSFLVTIDSFFYYYNYHYPCSVLFRTTKKSYGYLGSRHVADLTGKYL